MNNYFRRALTTSRVYLVENIDYDTLRDFLIESETLPASIIENIDSHPNRRQKLREMLDCLPRRSDLAFSTFLVALSESNQRHIACKLYESTINLIDPIDFQLKELLENNILTILSSSSSTITTTAATTGYQPEKNRVVSNTTPVLKLKQCRAPVENSYCSPIPVVPPSFDDQGQEIMDIEESLFKKNEPMSSSLKSNNQETCTTSSFKGSPCYSTFENQPKESSTLSSSFPAQQEQQSENNVVYQMDSSPRGLLCIITTAEEGAKLKSDALPVFDKKDREPRASPTMGNTTTERDATLQSLFWKFGFYSCVIEMEGLTFHSDKLNNTLLQFAQLPIHYKVNCCAIALLGFSVTDLHLSKIFSWFNNENCPSLAGKPKLFLIQVVGDNTTPSNLISGVKIPEDALVAVELEEINTQPALVTSLFQVCQQQQMKQPRYSVQEIFKLVQQSNNSISRRTVEIEQSLTKLWIVDPHCKLEKHDPLST